MNGRALLGAAILSASIAVACDPPGLGRARPDFRVIGHHGAPTREAENTIASFALAMDQGANAVEPDLCVTKDGVIVVLHDCDPDDAVALARQTGAEGFAYIPAVPPVGTEWRRPVATLTLDELRSHYGYAKLGQPRDPSIEIPTFDEFLEWARGEPRLKALYVDVKPDIGSVEAFVPMMDRLGSDPSLVGVRFVLLNVHTDVVDRLEEERSRLGFDSPRVAYDSESPGALDVTVAHGLRDVSIGLTPARTWSGLKEEVAASVEARERGRVDEVMVWTIDRETELAELLYYSVDGIITNDVRALRRMWQETLQ